MYNMKNACIILALLVLLLGCWFWTKTEVSTEPTAPAVGQDSRIVEPVEEDNVQRLANMINAVRKEHSLAPLRVSPVLNAAADGHAKNMAELNKLDHVLNGKSPSDRITKLGYRWTWCAENIAWNQQTLEKVMESWMNSAGHRKNILSPSAEEIGIGIVLSKKQEPYFCTVFAKPAKGN